MQKKNLNTNLVAALLVLVGVMGYGLFVKAGSLEPNSPPAPTMRTSNFLGIDYLCCLQHMCEVSVIPLTYPHTGHLYSESLRFQLTHSIHLRLLSEISNILRPRIPQVNKKVNQRLTLFNRVGYYIHHERRGI